MPCIPRRSAPVGACKGLWAWKGAYVGMGIGISSEGAGAGSQAPSDATLSPQLQ